MNTSNPFEKKPWSDGLCIVPVEAEFAYHACLGGDGGGGDGGGGSDDLGGWDDIGNDDTSAADAAASADAQSMASGFEGWGVSGLPGPGEEEDYGTGFIGVADPETGIVDPASTVSPNMSFSEAFGVTPTDAVLSAVDPSILGRAASFALGPAGLGLNALTAGILSTGIVEAGKAVGLDEASKEATGLDVTSGTLGQLFARGGPVRLQDGIGSLYGRR